MTTSASLEPQGHLLAPPLWRAIKDGDDLARAFFDDHYSRKHYADNRAPKLFVGPGEKLVLVTPDRLGLFVWRRFISGDGQEGVNCAVFRNMGAGLSSFLITAADAIADMRWPGQRHYTYVDAAATSARRSRNAEPGKCFIEAGWRRCGTTKWNKLAILERMPSGVGEPRVSAREGAGA